MLSVSLTPKVSLFQDKLALALKKKTEDVARRGRQTVTINMSQDDVNKAKEIQQHFAKAFMNRQPLLKQIFRLHDLDVNCELEESEFVSAIQAAATAIHKDMKASDARLMWRFVLAVGGDTDQNSRLNYREFMNALFFASEGKRFQAATGY